MAYLCPCTPLPPSIPPAHVRTPMHAQASELLASKSSGSILKINNKPPIARIKNITQMVTLLSEKQPCW